MTRDSPVVVGLLTALMVLGIVLGLWLIYQSRTIVVLLLISMIIAAAIDPLVDQVEGRRLPATRWRLPRWLALVWVLVLVLIVVAAILLYITSVFWTEGTSLWEDLPGYSEAVESRLEALRLRYPQIPPTGELVLRAGEQIGAFGGYVVQATAAIFGVIGGVVSMITILVLVFIITLSKEEIKRAFFSIIPPERHAQLHAVLAEASFEMGGWLRGQLMLGTIVTLVLSTVMWLLGLPYPLLLGLIAGVGELVPLVGSLIAGLIALPIALLTLPPWALLFLIVFFIVFSQLETHWLVPRILRPQVNLSPLGTVLALLVGLSLLGVVGAIIAIPLAAALRVILIRLVVPSIQEMYAGRNL
jgi:predicted PurR-regulated permease PerM